MRADAALTKQTAESAQPKTQNSRPPAKAEVVAAPPPADEQWSRRSYAILMACVFGVQVLIGVLLFLLASPPKDVEGLASVIIGFQPLQPVPQLAACMLAAPVAKRISGERRSLRIVETLMVGVIVYAIFFILLIASQFVITAAAPGTASSNGCGPTSVVPTPLAETSTPTPTPGGPSPTPCPSPSASPAASPSAHASASPSAGAAGTAASVTSAPASVVLSVFGAADVLAYVLAIFIYPPVYQRLRYKPPPPRDKPAGKGTSK